MTKRRCALLAAISAVLLASCSTADIPPSVYIPPAAPTPEKALEGARKAADEEKLVGAIEFSIARETKSFGPGRYLLCLRGSRSLAEPRRTYAVFFDNNDYKGARMSVILDECETQAFSPLPPVETIVPATAAAPRGHKKDHASIRAQ